MKKFLKRINLFFLPILIILIVIELSLGSVNNSYTYKNKLLINQKGSIKILILGPSYSLCGINPKLLKYPGFNMANNSQDLYYDYKIFQKYYQKLKNLRYLFIVVGYATLDYILDEGGEYWRSSFYKRFYGIEKRKYLFNIKDYSLIALYGIQESFKFALKKFKPNLVKNINKYGWQRLEILKNPEIRINDSNAKKYLKSYDKINYNNIKENLVCLECIISLSQRNNIKLILFTPPVTFPYSQNINKKKYIYMQKIIKLISVKYNISYYNYFNDYRFTLNDFSDIHHLNYIGAIKFTKIINNDIL